MILINETATNNSIQPDGYFTAAADAERYVFTNQGRN